MSIALDQVTKRYQGVPVVNDVSLNVRQGEFLVLLGPSGSGKSTLLRAIAGLTEIDHGRVSLHGRDVTHVNVRQREVGFVFQHYALFRHMTIGENIEFALRVRKVKAAERRARRKELLQAGGARGHGRPPAGAALGRPAAARRGGARAGAPAAGAADGRAVRRARRQDPRGTAADDPPDPARARHDHDPRHARPGRSLRTGRPHRRDAPGSPARVRRAGRALHASGDALRLDVPRCGEPAAGLPEPARGALQLDAGRQRRRAARGGGRAAARGSRTVRR